MSRRVRFAALALVCAGLAAVVAVVFWPSGKHRVAAPKLNLAAGKVDYRRFCGECHVLKAALSAGQGGVGSPGGGPSFDNLQVSFNISEAAIYGAFTGHEALLPKMSIQQINDVSAYIAKATRGNARVASMQDG